MKKYEQWVETAKREVVLKADWEAHIDKRYKMSDNGVGSAELDKMGLNKLTFDEYKKKYSKTCKPERADATKVEEWLKRERHFKPGKYKEKPQNLIEIVAKNVGPEKKDERICAVWLYEDDHRVCQVVFTERGMARIVNAGDLSTEEFVQALLKNYSDIQSFETDVKVDTERSTSKLTLQTYTWIYKDPRGFEAKVLDKGYYDSLGQRFNMKAYSKMQNETGIEAGILASSEKKWFAITAIKPESARKFD